MIVIKEESIVKEEEPKKVKKVITKGKNTGKLVANGQAKGL